MSAQSCRGRRHVGVWRSGGGHVCASVPHRTACLAQGGVLDGWRAGWARPDTGKTHEKSRRITTGFERGSACRQSVLRLPSRGFLDWCQVTRCGRGGHYRVVGVAGAGITGMWVWQGRALPGGGCGRGRHYQVMGVAGGGHYWASTNEIHVPFSIHVCSTQGKPCST